MGDFSQAPDDDDDDLGNFDDVSTTMASAPVAAATTTTTTEVPQPQQQPSSSSSLLLSIDDPRTREKMHDSIQHAIEAYILIFKHPQKTNKACELALDCTTELVKRGYFSGRAGGQDDESGSGSKSRDIPLNERPNESLLHRLMIASRM